MYFGKILGVRLKFNALFLLFVLSLAASGLLPEATIVFMVLMAHEMGHMLVARRLGVTIKEVEITPFGGVARLHNMLTVDPEVEAKVAIAGPAVNVLFIALALTLDVFWGINQSLLRLLLQANLVQALFNLLPAMPLDGGRIYRAFLAQRVGYQEATRKAARGGLLLGFSFCLITAIGVAVGIFNYNLLLLSAFLLFVVQRERRHAIYAFMSYLGTKESELKREKVLDMRHIAVDGNATIKDLFPHLMPRRYHLFTLIDKGKTSVTLTETEVLGALFRFGADTRIKEIRKKC